MISNHLPPREQIYLLLILEINRAEIPDCITLRTNSLTCKREGTAYNILFTIFRIAPGSGKRKFFHSLVGIGASHTYVQPLNILIISFLRCNSLAWCWPAALTTAVGAGYKIPKGAAEIQDDQQVKILIYTDLSSKPVRKLNHSRLTASQDLPYVASKFFWCIFNQIQKSGWQYVNNILKS